MKHFQPHPAAGSRLAASLVLTVIFASLLGACGAMASLDALPPLPTYDGLAWHTSTPPPAAASPSPAPTRLAYRPEMLTLERLCADLHEAWGTDWQRVIAVLEAVHEQRGQCDNEDPYLKLYPAYFNYGAWLEQRGNIPAAIAAYQKALAIYPQGHEAALALKRHNVLTPPPPPQCTEQDYRAALEVIPPYRPQGTGGFAQLEGSALVIDGQPFYIRGVNYYPSRAPWRRFLTAPDLALMAQEMDMIRDAGLNTLRIFLWHEALFDCPVDGAVPIPKRFALLDQIIGLAAARDLRLIVTLNDLPDLVVRPLYLHPRAANAQSAYIVERYRDEPAILAWDLRNEGDIDYVRGYVPARAVLDWLQEVAATVRAHDPNHLITAGWNENSHVTASVVDFLSFHHWRSAENLQQRIRDLRARSEKPILLQEVGYSSPGRTEARQAQRLREALDVAESSGLLGWLVWTAFDFPTEATCIPPACPSPNNAEHHYGLWRVDYTPKPALEMLRERFTAP